MSDVQPGVIQPQGLQWALCLDGRGGVRDVSLELGTRLPTSGHTWVHVDRSAEGLDAWLRGVAALSPARASALLAEETRPRIDPAATGGGLLLVLRAVNLNPGETPDDMVSIRMWIEASHTISLRQRKLKTTVSLRDELLGGEGPRDAGQLTEALVGGVLGRIEEALEALVERTDDLEVKVSRGTHERPRRTLAELRAQIVAMHRHLAPQRTVLGKLAVLDLPWLHEAQRSHLREFAERTARLVDELDTLRERGKVISDELNQIMAEQLNKRMYVLSLAAGLFLPLTLLAGVMGANVGGIPGSEHPLGFYVLSVILTLLGVGSFALIRAMGWLKGDE